MYITLFPQTSNILKGMISKQFPNSLPPPPHMEKGREREMEKEKSGNENEETLKHFMVILYIDLFIRVRP
jgi:hypothetical protein